MKSKAGLVVLVLAALVLGLAKVSFWPAVVAWCVTAGTVYVIERLFSPGGGPPRR